MKSGNPKVADDHQRQESLAIIRRSSWLIAVSSSNNDHEDDGSYNHCQ